MTTLELVSTIITAAALFGWFSVRALRLPVTIGTMLTTVLCSVMLIFLSGIYPSLHAWGLEVVARVHFEDFILHGILGLLLFAGAFLLDLHYLWREKLAVALLSVIGTLLSTVAVTLVMHGALQLLGLNANWYGCMFFGALISPTDPVAVLEMLHRTGVSKQIQAQLAGESLFNDGIGAVLFLAVLDSYRGVTPTVTGVALSLLLKSGGGLLLGVALAWVASELMRRVEAYQIEILLTLSLALGGYALGEALHVSAPLEAVAAGLALRRFNMMHEEGEIAHESIDAFWKAIDEVQNAILFVLLGLEVLVIPFARGSFAAGGVAVGAVIAVRVLCVLLVLKLLRRVQPGHASSLLTLSWGGLRGGLSTALALAVPAGVGDGWLLASTYLVVVFSVIVQGGTLDLFLRRMNGLQAGETGAGREGIG